jgi:5-methylcytosine-specific restriction endonuclease McrA
MMNFKEAGSLGGKISAIKSRERAIKKYYENPKVCLNCKKIISVLDNEKVYKTKKKKFCSQSCSVSFSNCKRGKEKYCPICNKFLSKKFLKIKYCSKECYTKAIKLKQIERYNSWSDLSKLTPSTLRRYILLVHEHKCQICKNVLWNNIDIPLVVDHIDGNSENCSKNNFRLICPNCDAQLPTYKGKNRGRGRFSRRRRYKEGKSY